MKKTEMIGIALLAAVISITGSAYAEEVKGVIPEDGRYLVDFDTDSSMFHVNEACEGKGILTVKDGEMQVHAALVSKNIVNLYPGLAQDAVGDEAGWLQPTTDTVTYSDGWVEDTNGFDIPVPALETEFDVALCGKKGKWYDHKVSVKDPERIPEDGEQVLPLVITRDDEEEQTSGSEDAGAEASPDGSDAAAGTTVGGEEAETESTQNALPDGTYTIEAKLEGGTGKAGIESPVELTVTNGEITADLTFSSPFYDYIVVGEVRYEPVNTEGNSRFLAVIPNVDEELTVLADTIAMSVPHEIEYTIVFEKETLTEKN